METTSTIRKRLTPAQREELLKRYRGSNLTQREFALQQGIALSTLQRWLHSEVLRQVATVRRASRRIDRGHLSASR